MLLLKFANTITITLLFHTFDDDTVLMNYINRIKLTNVGLLSVILSASMLATGCGKKSAQNTVVQVKPLSAPSLVYLSDEIEVDTATPEAWMAIAKSNYNSKRYARALRAANEALSIDNQLVEARQLAMLSAVKVTQSNINAYHDDALMSDSDKTEFKNTLTRVTTLVNSSD